MKSVNRRFLILCIGQHLKLYGSMLISVGNENSIKFVLSWVILFAQYGIIKTF